MKILVDVENDKEAFVLELLNSFQFTKAKLLTTYENEVLEDLHEAVLEVNQGKEGKKQAQSLNAFLNEL